MQYNSDIVHQKAEVKKIMWPIFIIVIISESNSNVLHVSQTAN